MLKVEPARYKLWKQYREGTPWRGEPKYFKAWLNRRERSRKLNWKTGRDGVIQQATLELDGFRVTVKVEYDEITRITDYDMYGDYSDEREDHYAIDRLEGEEPCSYSRDRRGRYYNEPRCNRYEAQRAEWLEVRKPEVVSLEKAKGKRLAIDLAEYKTGEAVTETVYADLRAKGYIAVPVQGRLVRRCRYDGVRTTTKHGDDTQVRDNIRQTKKIIDDWYEDRWFFYDVYAQAYKGDVELGSASCMGIDSIDEEHVDDMAYEIAQEAVTEAKRNFDKIRGTPDTRCELIVDVAKAGEDAEVEEPTDFDAWLGRLYAAIAGGTVLDLTEAPDEFVKFLEADKEIADRTRLYVNKWED